MNSPIGVENTQNVRESIPGSHGVHHNQYDAGEGHRDPVRVAGGDRHPPRRWSAHLTGSYRTAGDLTVLAAWPVPKHAATCDTPPAQSCYRRVCPRRDYGSSVTVQLWATAVVAALGYVATLAGSSLASRNAARLAVRLREIDRQDARHSRYETCCQEFVSAARVLRLSADDRQENDQASALAAVRRATAGIELYNSALAADAVLPALEAVERLVRARVDGVWSASVADAEADCDQALATARAALSTDLA